MRRDLLRQENTPSPSLTDRTDQKESHHQDFWHTGHLTPSPRDISDRSRQENADTGSVNDRNVSDSLNRQTLQDFEESQQETWQNSNLQRQENTETETPSQSLKSRKTLKDLVESHKQDFWENGRITPSIRVNSRLSMIVNDDDTTVASDVLDNDDTEAHFYIEDNFINNNEVRSPSPNMTRTNSSAKSVVTAKQRSDDEAQIASTEFKLNLEDDISQLIDNDEDALNEEYDSVRSPRVVNYLTNLPSPSHSSYLRRQRLTTVSTLDIPQGVEEEEEEERTDNTFVRPPSPPAVAGVAPRQSLAMQTLITNYRPIEQGWLAKKVTLTMTCRLSLSLRRSSGQARSLSMTGGLSLG